MSLEIKRKQLELSRVTVAKEEMLFKIDEKMEEISRLKGHVELQEQKQKEIEIEINKLKGE